MMSIEVIRPGLSTTIQDIGRYGYQKHGVIVSGAMDPIALRIANLLVGNAESAAGLEVTLVGPKLRFHKDLLISICGGNLSPSIAGKAIPLWRPIWVRGGSTLDFGRSAKGCRAYISVAGGIDVPEVLGSQSTYLRARLGGFSGRALKEGDGIELKNPEGIGQGLTNLLADPSGKEPFTTANWFVKPNELCAYDDQVVHVISGPEFLDFTLESRKQFFNDEYQITPQSDRMGYRLSGPALELNRPLELISEAVSMGTIQVPTEGQPIILMADRQTTGGYPKIGYVPTVDLPILAQFRPGIKLRFKEITLKDAQQKLVKREFNINIIKQQISLIGNRGAKYGQV
jgi:antagonist of KipI